MTGFRYLVFLVLTSVLVSTARIAFIHPLR